MSRFGVWNLGERLGGGASGEVWAVEGPEGPGALKWLFRPADARFYREVAALRLARLPGVVTLLDQGVYAGRPWVVMARAAGVPFPAGTWEQLAAPTRHLLAVLAGLHRLGLVHRDLKPQNVLVEHDRVTLVDLGLAAGPAVGARITQTGEVLGTPAYLAPEQIEGQSDARSDLYAVGVMLYEALSGRAAHPGADAAEVLIARLAGPPPPLAEVASVPVTVGRWVDRLLATAPRDRFESADDALDALEAPPIDLPFLGPDVDDRVLRLSRGQSVVIRGCPGSGRSRVLGRLAERLPHARVLTRSSAPFGSLIAAGLPAPPAHLSLREAQRSLRAAAARQLWLADDDIDPWTAQLLPTLWAARVVLGSRPACRLDAKALRPLFAGPDRILHRAEDAAQALFQRTRGLAAEVVREVDRAVRLGLARWQGAQLVVGQDTVSLWRLPGGTGNLRRASDWLRLGPGVSVSVLAAAAGMSRWRFEAGLSATATRAEEEAPVVVPASEGHRRLAVLVEDPGARLAHLIGAGEIEEARSLALILGESRLRAGREAEARELLTLARLGGVPTEALAPAWLRLGVALQSATELERLGARLSEDAPIRRLAEAFAAAARSPIAARTRIEALGELDDPWLESWRRVMAAVGTAADPRADPALADTHASALLALARRHQDGDLEARAHQLRGRLDYGRGQFRAAYLSHRRAAVCARSRSIQLSSWLNAGVAALEIPDLPVAIRLGQRSIRAAATQRHAPHEALGWWIVRTARWRRGEPQTADPDLAEHAYEADAPGTAVLIAVNEAALAYHGEDLALVRRLVVRWAPLARTRGNRAAWALLAALGRVVGEPPEGDLAAVLPSVPVLVAAQVARITGEPAWQWWDQQVPPSWRGVRREVM